MNQKHIIVVGAGPGGLTSAMILAHRGFKVTVFEAKETVGGRNAPLRLGDFTFDTGPTFLMMDFTLKDMFAEAGRKVEDYLQFRKLDTLYDLRFSGLELFSMYDRRQMKEEIRRHFPGNEDGLDRFLKKEGKRFAVLFPCLQRSYSSLSDMFSRDLFRGLPYLGLTRSIFDALGAYFKPDLLRLAFTFQSKYLGMSPWECPALFTMIPYIEHTYGIFHVTGGLNRISLAMAQAIIEEGGYIRTGTPVSSLILDGRSVKGVRLADGEEVYGDEIILNADFAWAMSHLVPSAVLRRYRPSKLFKMDFSCSTYMMYLGLDKLYPQAHHTVIFAREYRASVDRIFHEKTLPADLSIYVQNAGVTDPTLAPKGKSGLYVLVPVPNRKSTVDWRTEKARLRERVLDIITERTMMKDLREHIVAEKIVTPLDWEQDHNIYLGATFNLSHKLSQMLYFRPHNKFEELDHCYLTGGGTHPGSGLPTIYESARIAANMISDLYGVPYQKPSPLTSKQVVESREEFAQGVSNGRT